MRKLIKNSIRTPDGTVLTSRHRHDFKSHKDKNIYTAQICVNYKKIHLGQFSTVVEGAIAYNNYIIENNLEGYNLNEIPQESFN